MKKTLLSLVFAILASTAFAEKLVVEQRDGEKTSFEFSERPIVKLVGSNYVVKTRNSTLQFASVDVKKFVIEHSTDDIVTPKPVSREVRGVKVYSMNGTLVYSSNNDELDTSSLVSGTYVVRNGSVSYKIFVK